MRVLIKSLATYAKNVGGLIMDTTAYRCTVCGYVYDPTKGDDVSGIPPGTSFEDLPADYVCPVCGAPKDMFEKVE
jgi:rubredoxin